MSAREILQEHLKTMGQEPLNDSIETFVLFAMDEYAQSLLKEKLKEQREICAKIIKDSYNLDSIPNSNRVNDMVEEDILNAPEPKI